MSGLEITLRDVYDKLGDVDSKVTGLAGHLEAVNARLESGQARMADHEARLRVIEQIPKVEAVPGDHEKRIRGLEKLAWKLVGAFAAVNALAVLAEWLLWAHR